MKHTTWNPTRHSIRLWWNRNAVTVLVSLGALAVILWVDGVDSRQDRWNALYDRCEIAMRQDSTASDHEIADVCGEAATRLTK